MRSIVLVAFAAAALTANLQPASAAYCGPAADSRAVEKLAIKQFRHKIDKTYVMNVDVIGNWARADVSYSGEAFLFFHKANGAWTFQGNFPPKMLPASAAKQFDARQYPRCKNPAFIARGSG